MTRDDACESLANAIDNIVTMEPVQITCVPFDALTEIGAVVMLHDGMITVEFEGDSETFELDGDRPVVEEHAIDSLAAMMEVNGVSLDDAIANS